MKKKKVLWTMAAAGVLFCAAQFVAPQKAQAQEILYNVEDYGIVGDGTTDVTYQLQSLLREADTLSEGDTLVLKFPEGTYITSDLLKIYSNTTLDLSAGAELYRTNFEHPMMMNVGEGGSWKEDDPEGGGYNLSKNITIKGGTINGGDVEEAENTGNVVNIAHAQNITVEGVTFKNCYGAHLLEFSGVKDASVTGCDFSGFRPEKSSNQSSSEDSSNANKSGYSAKECIQLDYTYFDEKKESLQWCPGYYSDKTPCKNITIDGNNFHDYPRGVGNHHGRETFSSLSTDNVVIKNNTFQNMYVIAPNGKKVYDYVISLHSFKNAIVEKNSIKNAGSAILFAYEENSKVRNNTIEDLNWSALVLTKNAKGSSITGNTFVDVPRYGITVTNGASASSFSNNTLKVGSKKTKMINGITVSGTKSYISNITGNRISGCSKFGVSLVNVKKSKKIDTNTFSSCAKGAICVTTSTCDSVSKNKITGVKQNNSIVICKKSLVKTIVGNTVNNSGKHGISISGTTTVTNLNSNVINNSAGNGICVSDKSKVTNMNSNKIKGSSIGISILQSTCEKVNSNTVTTSKKIGICSTTSKVNYIQSNTITDAKKGGIIVCKKSTSKRIAKNKFSKVKGKKLGIDKTSKVKAKK